MVDHVDENETNRLEFATIKAYCSLKLGDNLFRKGMFQEAVAFYDSGTVQVLQPLMLNEFLGESFSGCALTSCDTLSWCRAFSTNNNVKESISSSKKLILISLRLLRHKSHVYQVDKSNIRFESCLMAELSGWRSVVTSRTLLFTSAVSSLCQVSTKDSCKFETSTLCSAFFLLQNFPMERFTSKLTDRETTEYYTDYDSNFFLLKRISIVLYFLFVQSFKEEGPISANLAFDRILKYTWLCIDCAISIVSRQQTLTKKTLKAFGVKRLLSDIMRSIDVIDSIVALSLCVGSSLMNQLNVKVYTELNSKVDKFAENGPLHRCKVEQSYYELLDEAILLFQKILNLSSIVSSYTQSVIFDGNSFRKEFDSILTYQPQFLSTVVVCSCLKYLAHSVKCLFDLGLLHWNINTSQHVSSDGIEETKRQFEIAIDVISQYTAIVKSCEERWLPNIVTEVDKNALSIVKTDIHFHFAKAYLETYNSEYAMEEITKSCASLTCIRDDVRLKHLWALKCIIRASLREIGEVNVCLKEIESLCLAPCEGMLYLFGIKIDLIFLLFSDAVTEVSNIRRKINSRYPDVFRTEKLSVTSSSTVKASVIDHRQSKVIETKKTDTIEGGWIMILYSLDLNLIMAYGIVGLFGAVSIAFIRLAYYY